MINFSNVILVIAILIGLDIYKKKTLDVRGLGLKAIKIAMLYVVVKSLIAAITAVIDPGMMNSIMNRNVDVALANVVVCAISTYMFLNVEKMYKYAADIISGAGKDLKSIIPVKKKTDEAAAS